MAEQKILIVGAHGMLGSDLNLVLSPKWALGHKDLDITNRQEVLEKISALKPDVIINCAAFTNVDGAEDDPEGAFLLNGEAVSYLVEAAKKVDAILVHYSTDYVFDGEKDGEYEEDDFTGPINVYGESKLRGEQYLEGKFYLIRTSWLYGKNGQNFVDTMLELADKYDEIKVVNDQVGKPTWTLDLAKATADLLSVMPDFGVYHLVNEGALTWYDFAREIFKSAGQDVKVSPVTTGEFPRPAKRPMNSTLKNAKRPELRPVKEALDEYLD